MYCSCKLAHCAILNRVQNWNALHIIMRIRHNIINNTDRSIPVDLNKILEFFMVYYKIIPNKRKRTELFKNHQIVISTVRYSKW